VLQLLLVVFGVATKGVEQERQHEQPQQGQRQRVLVQRQGQPALLDRAGRLGVVALLAGVLVDLVAVGLLGLRDPFWISQAVNRT
jgi:hypothetical protein